MKSVVDRFRDKMKEREEQGKEAEEFSKSLCPDCGKFPCECDDRARKTSMDLCKNKLRARGLKMSFNQKEIVLMKQPILQTLKILMDLRDLLLGESLADPNSMIKKQIVLVAERLLMRKPKIH